MTRRIQLLPVPVHVGTLLVATVPFGEKRGVEQF